MSLFNTLLLLVVVVVVVLVVLAGGAASCCRPPVWAVRLLPVYRLRGLRVFNEYFLSNITGGGGGEGLKKTLFFITGAGRRFGCSALGIKIILHTTILH